MKNPALRKEKRYQPAPVIPLTQDESLLDWLDANNRIKYREDKGNSMIDEVNLSEDEEISDLIDAEEEEYDSEEESDDEDLL